MNFEDLPEEVQQQILYQQEIAGQQAMVHHDSMNRLNEFLFGLDTDHSLMLATLLGLIGDASNASEIANYYEGLVRGHMAAKFGVCPTHGVDHAAVDLAAMTGSTQPGDKVAVLATPRTREEAEQYSTETHLIEIDSLMNDLTKYRVGFAEDIDVETDETTEALRTTHVVVCLNCTLQYPSLADRMLKEPDDCSGCHIKAAHG